MFSEGNRNSCCPIKKWKRENVLALKIDSKGGSICTSENNDDDDDDDCSHLLPKADEI